MRYISVLGLVSLFSSTAMATEFYVNPNGNDLWSGKIKQANGQQTDGPFKTLAKAKLAIKALKQNNAFTGKVNVNIASGTYYLPQSLNFDLTDSGVLGKEIVWQGEPNSNVTISGGIPLNCSKQSNGLWECPLTTAPAATTFFDTTRIKGSAPKFQLYVNGQKLALARWPDQGWAHIKAPITATSKFSTLQTLPAFSGNVRLGQVHIFPNNDWHDQIIAINSIDPATNSIGLSSTTTYSLATGRRFYIQNIQSALNAPGEWFYDSTNKKIMFIPPAGVVPNQIIVSSLPNLVTMNGTNYISWQNLTFQHSTGHAVNALKSNYIGLDKLNVNNVGGRGVTIDDGSNVKLTNSSIHHTGAAGVYVYGGDRKTLKPSGHVIHNNHIHHFGTTLMTRTPGIDALGVGIQMTHNLLEEGPATGIWITGNDHLVEKNELNHICMQSSDCGAIYSGRDWTFRGNIIRNNYIHDIIGYGLANVDIANKTANYRSPDDAKGIYLDDGASGFDVGGNILDNAGRIAIQIGGGRDNKLHDNYIKTSQHAIWIDDRWPTYDWNVNQTNLNAMPYKNSLWSSRYPELAAPMHNSKWPEGNRIERNLIVSNSSKDDGLTFRYIVPVDSTVIADNMVWNTTNVGMSVDYTLLELQKTKHGSWNTWVAENVEQGSLYADPCVTISNKKATFCATSAAPSLGFRAIPTDIGLIP